MDRGFCVEVQCDKISNVMRILILQKLHFWVENQLGKFFWA